MRQCKGRVEQGFSLIELMITLTIAGILLAVCVPEYKRYGIKVQVTDAQQSAMALTLTADSYYEENGVYPGTTAAERMLTAVNDSETMDGYGYWSNAAATTLTDGQVSATGQIGQVFVNFKADAFEGVTGSMRVYYEATRDVFGNSGGWTCVYHSTQTLRLVPDALPADCNNLTRVAP